MRIAVGIYVTICPMTELCPSDTYWLTHQIASSCTKTVWWCALRLDRSFWYVDDCLHVCSARDVDLQLVVIQFTLVRLSIRPQIPLKDVDSVEQVPNPISFCPPALVHMRATQMSDSVYIRSRGCGCARPAHTQQLRLMLSALAFGGFRWTLLDAC